MVNIQRPSGVNVGVSNPGEIIYIKGNETTDGSFRITLNDLETLVLFETRVSGVWESADITVTTALETGQVPKADTDGALIYGGATVDPSSGVWTFDETITVPSGSVELGQTMTISEGGGDLVVADVISAQMSFSVNSKFSDATGAQVPSFVDYGAPITINVNLDDSQVLTANPLTFTLTQIIIPSTNLRVIDRVIVRANGFIDNFRAKITDQATGIVMRYFPNKAAFDGVTPGFELTPGDNTFFLAEVGINTPGNFFLGYVPIAVVDGQIIDVEFIADAMDLLGNVSGIPYSIVEVHDGPEVDLVVAAGTFTEGSVVFINSAGELTEDNPNFFWDDSTNQLGIGTNTPTHQVEIDGGAFNGTLAIRSGSGASSKLLLEDESGVDKLDIAYVDTTGNTNVSAIDADLAVQTNAGQIDIRSVGGVLVFNDQITVDEDGEQVIFQPPDAFGETGFIFRDNATAQQASVLYREAFDDFEILTNQTFRMASNDDITLSASNAIQINSTTSTINITSSGDMDLDAGSGDIILDAEIVQLIGGSAGYQFEHDSDDLHLVSLGSDSILEMFTATGDGTEIVRIGLFDVGTSASQVNSERLVIQSNNGEYLIQMFATGTGVQRDLKIGSTAGNPVNFVALAAGGTSIDSENGEDVTISSDDDILMTPTGNVGINTPAPLADLHISNTSASIRTTGSGSELRIVSSTQTDISNRVTTGVANFDFTNLPLDNISQANFRFGAQSGSTGNNSLQLFDPNGSTIQTLFRSSAGNSYINALGGSLAVGATLAETLLHITNIAADTTPIQQWETTGTNGGSIERFVGDRDPNGNITGMGGDEYIRDSGTISSRFFNKAITTDTVWRENSLISEGALEIWSLDDLPAPIGDVITLPSGLYKFMQPINFGTTRLDTTNNSVQMYAENSFVNALTYEGTGTFITASDTSGVRVFYPGITFVLSGDGATFCDIVGSIGIQFSSILFTHANGGHLGTVTGKDTGALTSSRFIMTRTVVRQWLTGFNISDTSRSYCNTLNIFSHVNASSGFINIVDADALMFVVNVEVEINNVNASFINIDPTNPNPFYLNNNFLTGVGPFFQTGVTGTFTAVADNSLAATVINSVADDGSGNALFSTGAAVPIVGQTIVISGFVTNTDYNGTFFCHSTGPGVFEAVDAGGTQVAFGTTETGSVAGDGVTVTSAAHGLLDDQTLALDCDLSTEYAGGYKIYNVQTNSFDVNAVFGATQTGEWDTSSKTGASPGVRTFTNEGAEDSHFIATAFVNNNTTANGAIVNNTFTDIVFGTVGSALIEGSTAERWKLVDEINGTFEYQGDTPFDGSITFDFTSVSSGGAQDFRYKWEHDIGAGFVDLPDAVEALASIGSASRSVSKTFPLSAVNGDQIKPQITRNAGTSGITNEYATVYATQ